MSSTVRISGVRFLNFSVGVTMFSPRPLIFWVILHRQPPPPPLDLRTLLLFLYISSTHSAAFLHVPGSGDTVWDREIERADVGR